MEPSASMVGIWWVVITDTTNGAAEPSAVQLAGQYVNFQHRAIQSAAGQHSFYSSHGSKADAQAMADQQNIVAKAKRDDAVRKAPVGVKPDHPLYRYSVVPNPGIRNE